MKLHYAGYMPLMDAHTFYQLISLDKVLMKIEISLFLGLFLTYISKSNQHHQDHSKHLKSLARKKVPIFYFSAYYRKKKSWFSSPEVF